MSIDGPLAAVLAEVEDTVLERHEKYGPKNIALSPGGPLNGLRVRLHDKLARLNNFVDGGAGPDFTDDSLRDCFVDVAGYALIGLLVLDGDWPDGLLPEPEAVTFPVINNPLDLPWSQHILEREEELPAWEQELQREDPERVGARRRCVTGAAYVRGAKGWYHAPTRRPPRGDVFRDDDFRGATVAELDAHSWVTGPTVEIS